MLYAWGVIFPYVCKDLYCIYTSNVTGIKKNGKNTMLLSLLSDLLSEEDFIFMF